MKKFIGYREYVKPHAGMAIGPEHSEGIYVASPVETADISYYDSLTEAQDGQNNLVEQWDLDDNGELECCVSYWVLDGGEYVKQ